MAITRYQQGNSDDLAPLNSVGIDDDSSTGWWGGAQNCFANIALAAVLAATTLSTAVAQHVATPSDESDIPAGSLVNVSSDYNEYWQNPVFPLQSSLFQRLPIGDTEESIVPTPPSQDEDFWQNPVTPVPASLYQRLPLGDSEESIVPTAVQDEDFWQNEVFPAPVQASLFQRLPIGDPEELPAGSLFGQFDEDFWRNPVAPVQPSVYRSPLFSDPEEVSAGALVNAKQDNDDLWQNPARPVAGTLYQTLPYLFDSEALPLVTALDEDFWRNPVAPVAATHIWPQPCLFDVQEPGTLVKAKPDEDYWTNSVRPVLATVSQTLPYAFESEAVPNLQAPVSPGGASGTTQVIYPGFQRKPVIPAITGKVRSSQKHLFRIGGQEISGSQIMLASGTLEFRGRARTGQKHQLLASASQTFIGRISSSSPILRGSTSATGEVVDTDLQLMFEIFQNL